MERSNKVLNLKESDSLLYTEETASSVNYEGTTDEMLNMEMAIAVKMSNRMIIKLQNEIADLKSQLGR